MGQTINFPIKTVPWQIAHSSASIEVGVIFFGNFFDLNIWIFSLLIFDSDIWREFRTYLIQIFKLMIDGCLVTHPSGIDEGCCRNNALFIEKNSCSLNKV